MRFGMQGQIIDLAPAMDKPLKNSPQFRAEPAIGFGRAVERSLGQTPDKAPAPIP